MMEQYYDEPKTWDELQGVSFVIYEREISDRVVVQVSQIWEERGDYGPRERSQYLALGILDKATGRWICLRLSTVRKIWKFLVGKKFDNARRLDTWEIKKVQKEEGKKLARLMHDS